MHTHTPCSSLFKKETNGDCVMRPSIANEFSHMSISLTAPHNTCWFAHDVDEDTKLNAHKNSKRKTKTKTEMNTTSVQRRQRANDTTLARLQLILRGHSDMYGVWRDIFCLLSSNLFLLLLSPQIFILL